MYHCYMGRGQALSAAKGASSSPSLRCEPKQTDLDFVQEKINSALQQANYLVEMLSHGYLKFAAQMDDLRHQSSEAEKIVEESNLPEKVNDLGDLINRIKQIVEDLVSCDLRRMSSKELSQIRETAQEIFDITVARRLSVVQKELDNVSKKCVL